MEPDEAARAEPCRTGFAAKAWRVGDVSDRQRFLGDDFLPVQIGDGNFRRRCEVKFVALASVKLLLEFRELGSADERRRAHDKWRGNLGVSVGPGMQIEEEIDQGPLQARAPADIAGERAATDFGSALEIKQSKAFTNFEVGARREIEPRLLAD